MKMTPSTLRAVIQALTDRRAYRQIQTLTGVSKSTIGRIASNIARLNLSYNDLLALSDEQCYQSIFPSVAKRMSEPDWFEVNKLAGKPKVTLERIYQDYAMQVCPEHCYSYASFCRRYNDWLQQNGIRTYVGGNNEYQPGDRLEIDFVGDDLKWVNHKGEICSSRLFVAALPYSKLFFTKAFKDETQDSWISGIIDALEYIGGVPNVIVMDNAKALVKRSSWINGEIQPAILSLCNYYGMTAWACKPATPKQKNRVEAAAYDVERWIIAEMSLKQIPLAYDLDDLNNQIRRHLDRINDRPFKNSRSNESRRSKFLSEESANLRPLPKKPYEVGNWKILLADKAHCIQLSSDFGHRYSVPAQYIGKKVGVRVWQNKVEIYDLSTMQLIGQHQRFRNSQGSKTHILEEHLTAAEKSYRRSTKDWIRLYVSKGVDEQVTINFVNTVFGSDGTYPAGRVCYSVLTLLKRYSPLSLTNAISAAIEADRASYHRIKALCERYEFASEHDLTLSLLEQKQQPCVLHENIRADYE